MAAWLRLIAGCFALTLILINPVSRTRGRSRAYWSTFGGLALGFGLFVGLSYVA